jgi:alkyl sulfatase BDS1-like metallo-beta-lactamase superfamily hydrolase
VYENVRFVKDTAAVAVVGALGPRLPCAAAVAVAGPEATLGGGALGRRRWWQHGALLAMGVAGSNGVGFGTHWTRRSRFR